MNLSDLFVSYKQVDPVKFDGDKPEVIQPIYLNLDRAKKITVGESPSAESSDEDVTSWKVEMDDWESGYEPGWSVRDESTTSSKRGETLSKYRSNAGYTRFKTELDTFIKNNPNYSSIKDSLDYLAALESSYNINAKNTRGSSALGWFQFLDATRSVYNTQSRADFAKDAQAQLMAAA